MGNGLFANDLSIIAINATWQHTPPASNLFWQQHGSAAESALSIMGRAAMHHVFTRKASTMPLESSLSDHFRRL